MAGGAGDYADVLAQRNERGGLRTDCGMGLWLPALYPALAALAVLVLWLHRANITRLRAGTEPKVGGKK